MKKQLFLMLFLGSIFAPVQTCDLPGYSVFETEEDKAVTDESSYLEQLEERVQALTPQNLAVYASRLTPDQYLRVTTDIVSTNESTAQQIQLRTQGAVREIDRLYDQGWQRTLGIITNNPDWQGFLRMATENVIKTHLTINFKKQAEIYNWLVHPRKKLLSEAFFNRNFRPFKEIILGYLIMENVAFFTRFAIQERIVNARQDIPRGTLEINPVRQLHFNNFNQNGALNPPAHNLMHAG